MTNVFGKCMTTVLTLLFLLGLSPLQRAWAIDFNIDYQSINPCPGDPPDFCFGGAALVSTGWFCPSQWWITLNGPGIS